MKLKFKFPAAEKIKKIYQSVDALFRNRASDILEWEVAELEHVFSLLVLGNFVGLPIPVWQISLELLPDMEDQLIDLLQREQLAAAPLSDLFSYLDIG